MFGLEVASNIIKLHAVEQHRPDKLALISSGMFDECLAVVQSYEQRGAADVHGTDGGMLYQCLGKIRDGLDQPGSVAKIRAASLAFGFCLSNDKVLIAEIGYTTATIAANICAGVFGRDDGENLFAFTQSQVDTMCVTVSLSHAVAIAALLTYAVIAQADCVVGYRDCHWSGGKCEAQRRHSVRAGAGDLRE